MKLRAFAEFDRFSFKNHQRQEQPRQGGQLQGTIVALTCAAFL